MKKNLLIPFLAALLLGFTVLGAWVTFKKISRQQELLRVSAHRQVVREVSSRMETYVNVLRQTRSMFYVTRDVDRQEFFDYVRRLGILERYPGIQGIGFALKVNASEIFQHEQTIRKEVSDYRLWPRKNDDTKFPIIYLEPLDWRNKRALGYDMYSEPVRNEAMTRAIVEDKASMSGPVELVQETEDDSQIGFLIYVPVYRQGQIANSVRDRMENVLGLVYSPFRTRDLFGQVMLGLSDLKVDVRIDFEEKRIFERYPKVPGDEVWVSSTLAIAGKSWIVSTRPLPAFYPESSAYVPGLILFFGTLLTLVVIFFLRRVNSQAQVLEERSQALEQINDATKALVSSLELKDVLQTLTDIGRELTKAQFGAFFYNTVDERGESYMLYTLSGVEKSHFEKFPMPRNTAIFSPTFNGETVLSDDITLDPRFGKNEPYHGLPQGHLPVRSYLAVAVKSRSGEVLGALFYGHSRPGRFSEQEMKLIEGLSQQAAIAIENANLYEKAQKAIAVREEFLSVASHELKTPITSMKIQFQVAMRLMEVGDTRVYDSQAVRKRVTVALRQLDKMLSLIEEMLDSSRIALGKLEVRKSNFNFRKLVRDLIERYDEQFRSLGIPVSSDLGPEESVDVSGDEYRLEQVITNLINNAIKYGAGSLIDISLKWDPESVSLIVRDHGVGIPPENLHKIFERYERLVSSTNVSGLGLGLYISKTIVEAHGGNIHVHSSPGAGAEFTVEIPRR